MRPIRLRKDDVVVDKRNRSGTGFPTCCRCWQPVHGYGIEEERRLKDGTKQLDVYAECHGKREVKILTVPLGMSKETFMKGLALLVFFADASTQGALSRRP